MFPIFRTYFLKFSKIIFEVSKLLFEIFKLLMKLFLCFLPNIRNITNRHTVMWRYKEHLKEMYFLFSFFYSLCSFFKLPPLVITAIDSVTGFGKSKKKKRFFIQKGGNYLLFFWYQKYLFIWFCCVLHHGHIAYIYFGKILEKCLGRIGNFKKYLSPTTSFLFLPGFLLKKFLFNLF